LLPRNEFDGVGGIIASVQPCNLDAVAIFRILRIGAEELEPAD
jgi:hypothetical protein